MKSLSSLAGLVLLSLSLLSPTDAAAEDARVIVKLRADSATLKRALAADRTRSLAGRLGIALQHRAEPAPGVHALLARGVSTATLLAQLAADPDVEYAVPDQLRRARAQASDPLYLGQWYLQSVQPAAIRADAAWNVSTGSDTVVVAVLDTGVRPEHPDLASRLLPGYDFITEASLAGDGSGRDSDATDPGDFVTSVERSDADLLGVCGGLSGLPLQNSSWHGTRVSGVIAAAANNATGLAGVTWSGRVLPLRVLGKCGGFDSDIIAAMRWAAGLSVPGVPANPNPARVLNLSLGGAGICTRAYQDAISAMRNVGALMVVSAGNETGPVESPANCEGVLAVAGVRHVGTKVGFSSLGTEVGISAPAGNCVNSFLPCLFPINTTSNAGTTTAGASIYTDGNRPNVGTSFSAPQVAGVAALMLARNPALTPDEVIARIRSSARPFPVDASLPTCPTTADGVDSSGQCNCTTTTCGAGLLDAAAAVAAAGPPVASIAPPLNPQAGAAISLDGSGSQALPGRSLVAFEWRLVEAPAGASLTNPNAAITNLQAPEAGTYVIQLTVTDDLGASSQALLSLAIAAPPTTPGSSSSASGSSSSSSSSSSGGGGGGGSSDAASVLGLTLIGMLAWLGRRRPAASHATLKTGRPGP